MYEVGDRVYRIPYLLRYCTVHTCRENRSDIAAVSRVAPSVSSII